jgi:hypothetical protein
MTSEDFRKVALSFPQTCESSHMNHPDFRVGNRIFATLGHPQKAEGIRAGSWRLGQPRRDKCGTAHRDGYCPAPGTAGSLEKHRSQSWPRHMPMDTS